MEQKKRFEAFTLLELLVVVAIISILAMVLLPVISRVRHTAHEKICANNLRQASLALVVYANSNNDFYPLEPTEHNPHKSLLEKLGAYRDGGLFEAFYCPSAYELEEAAQSITSVPVGAVDSVIDTPENRFVGNISYIYWSFWANKVYEPTGKTWRDPKYFIPRRLKLTGALPIAPEKTIPDGHPAQRWVLSDYFRKKAPFPHGRKSGNLGGGLNVVFLDGHTEIVFGQPRASYR